LNSSWKRKESKKVLLRRQTWGQNNKLKEKGHWVVMPPFKKKEYAALV